MFAKLYETDIGQILAISDDDESGAPEVRIYFKPDGLGVCHISHVFSDNEKGVRHRNELMDNLTEEKAVAFVRDIISQVKQ